MSNSDKNTWMDQTYRAGRDVDSYIDKAIQSGDYSLLNEQINRTMNQAVDAMHDAILGSSYKTGNIGTAYEQAQAASNLNKSEVFAFGAGHVNIKPDGAAKIMNIIGTLGLAVNVLFTIAMLVPTAVLPSVFVPGVIFFVIAALVFNQIRKSGKKRTMRVSEAKKIMKLAKGRDVVSVDEIASFLGQGVDETRKELREMLSSGVMTGTVYLDKDGTTLMLSKEAYQQYGQVMKAYKERQKEEKARARKEAREAKKEAKKSKSGQADEQTWAFGGGDSRGPDIYDEPALGGRKLKEYKKMQDQEKARRAYDAKVDAETRKILDEGYAFIDHIHQKNDEIPGEEISAKLDRLEKIVRSIFEQVERNPESAPDLHKLMSYYLPTTRKLVDTYATLDAQHIEGDNIENAKKQIENSLDTINDAYEKLFDSFFRQTAWDVGTDVSVMKSMLQQDGLADDELQRMKKEARFGGGAAMAVAPDSDKETQKK